MSPNAGRGPPQTWTDGEMKSKHGGCKGGVMTADGLDVRYLDLEQRGKKAVCRDNTGWRQHAHVYYEALWWFTDP